MNLSNERSMLDGLERISTIACNFLVLWAALGVLVG